MGALAASPDFGKGQGASLVCLQTRGDVASTLRASAGAGDIDTGENVICIACDTANAAVDEDMAGTLKCAGGGPCCNGEVVGTLCARDYKGISADDVMNGKLIIEKGSR